MNLLEALSKLPSLSPKALAVISGGVVALGSLLRALLNPQKNIPPADAIMERLSKDNPNVEASNKTTTRKIT
jgi:hypothetical protein